MKIKTILIADAILLLSLGMFYSFGQDSTRVKNRHNIPDTTRDTLKGVLIDTINLKNQDQIRKMNENDSLKRSK